MDYSLRQGVSTEVGGTLNRMIKVRHPELKRKGLIGQGPLEHCRVHCLGRPDGSAYAVDGGNQGKDGEFLSKFAVP